MTAVTLPTTAPTFEIVDRSSARKHISRERRNNYR